MITRDPFLSLSAAAELIRTKALSPVELTRAALERIQELDDRIHAFITVSAADALVQAKAAEREITAGNRRGPLHGIPFSLKMHPSL